MRTHILFLQRTTDICCIASSLLVHLWVVETRLVESHCCWDKICWISRKDLRSLVFRHIWFCDLPLNTKHKLLHYIVINNESLLCHGFYEYMCIYGQLQYNHVLTSMYKWTKHQQSFYVVAISNSNKSHAKSLWINAWKLMLPKITSDTGGVNYIYTYTHKSHDRKDFHCL